LIAAGAKDQVDLVMRGQKPLGLPLGLPVGFEPAHYLLSFAGWAVRHFDRVVQALVGAMVCIRGQCSDRLDVAAQFVRDDHPRLAKLCNQSLEQSLCSLGVPACLHENIKNISPRVDRAPKPVLLATDPDPGFVPSVSPRRDRRRCHLSVGRVRSRRMQSAKCRPKRLTQSRTVYRLTITPRAANRSSTSAVLRARGAVVPSSQGAPFRSSVPMP